MNYTKIRNEKIDELNNLYNAEQEARYRQMLKDLNISHQEGL